MMSTRMYNGTHNNEYNRSWLGEQRYDRMSEHLRSVSQRELVITDSKRLSFKTQKPESQDQRAEAAPPIERSNAWAVTPMEWKQWEETNPTPVLGGTRLHTLNEVQGCK